MHASARARERRRSGAGAGALPGSAGALLVAHAAGFDLDEGAEACEAALDTDNARITAGGEGARELDTGTGWGADRPATGERGRGGVAARRRLR